jgi:hypothetical protein
LGGNIRLTAGSGVGSGGVGTGYAGGSVILTPGVGSTNGHIEIAGGSVGSHLRSTQATAPTIADNGNCATTTLTAAGTDMAGSIVFAAGSGATVPCVLTLTFNSPYAAAPKAVILTPGNQSAAAKMIETYAAATTSNFTITFFGAAVTNGFTYSLYYLIIE